MGSDGSGHPSGPYFTIDLHLHTNRGSADSNLSLKDLVDRSRTIGIGAVCITEHDNAWNLKELEPLADGSGVIFLHGMEVTTEMGHIGVFGLTEYLGGIYKLRELRKVVDKLGGIMIANHPFRYKLDPRFAFMNSDQEALDADHPERAAKIEIMQVCDAVEVLNGACSEEENLFALKVARSLGLAEVAGSDSHSANSVGCVTTLLPGPVHNERELIELIKARRSRAGRGLLKGVVEPFDLSA